MSDSIPLTEDQVLQTLAAGTLEEKGLLPYSSR